MPRRVPEYQPFFAEAMGGIKNAFADKRTRGMEEHKNKLASSAYMGDPTALQELSSVDPQLAMEIEDQSTQRKTRTKQDEMAKDSAFAAESQDVMKKIANFPDFASAQAFGQRMKDYMFEKYPDRTAAQGEGPEFTEQNFMELKSMSGVQPAARQTSVVKGALVDEATGDVIYQAPPDSTISDRATMLVDTPEGQILIDKGTGEEINRFAAKPVTAKPEKDATAAELKAAGFLSRMTASEGELNRVLDEFPDFDPSSKAERAKGMSNLTASSEYQQYKQAADDWIRAKLRLESGAVIAEEEMAAEYRTYFPQVGDEPAVIAQKERARKMAEKQMTINAGRAMSKLESPGADIGEMSDEELDRLLAGGE